MILKDQNLHIRFSAPEKKEMLEVVKKEHFTTLTAFVRHVVLTYCDKSLNNK